MPSFTDAKGKTWPVEITIGTIKQIRTLLNADFGNPLEGDPPPLTRFLVDIEFIADVLFVVCQDDAEKHKITGLEFAKRLDGDASITAHDAFLEALSDFFLRVRRPEVAALIQKSRDRVARAVEAASKVIASPAFDKTMDDEISGHLSTSMRESSESTPDPSPGDH